MPDPAGAQLSSRRRKGLWRDLFAPPEFYRERREAPPTRFEAFFEPAVLVATVLLLVQGLVQFGLALAPAWRTDVVLPLSLVVAVVAYLYSRRLARGVVIWREWVVLLVLPLLVARFAPYVSDGDLLADARSWIAEPLGLFDAGFLARVGVVAIAWWQTFFSTQDLNDVRLQPGEIGEAPRTVIERAWESDRLRTIDHTTPFARLASRFLTGGVTLIVVAALTASSVRQLLSIDAIGQLLTLGRPSSSLALVNVVAYWVSALLLLAEAQYVRTRTLWQLDRVEVAPGVAARWGGAAALLVGAGVVAALLAPTDGLLGLADIVRAAFAVLLFVASALAVVAYLAFWALTYPLRWLFGSGGDEGPSAPPITPPALPPVEAGDGSLAGLIKSLLFWLIAAGVVGYALVALWRQGRLQALLPTWLATLGARVVSLLAALGALLARIGRRAADGALEVGRRLARLRPDSTLGRRSRGALSGLLPGRDPRWIVIAIYGLLMARAGERGLERRPGQTALEYRARLREGVPGAAEDVDRLTDAFVRARYGPRPVAPDDASLARRCWEHIRGQLRRPAARP